MPTKLPLKGVWLEVTLEGNWNAYKFTTKKYFIGGNIGNIEFLLH